MITTHESTLHEIDGFILHPLTQLPNYSHQWFVADVRYPRGNKPHLKVPLGATSITEMNWKPHRMGSSLLVMLQVGEPVPAIQRPFPALLAFCRLSLGHSHMRVT